MNESSKENTLKRKFPTSKAHPRNGHVYSQIRNLQALQWSARLLVHCNVSIIVALFVTTSPQRCALLWWNTPWTLSSFVLIECSASDLASVFLGRMSVPGSKLESWSKSWDESWEKSPICHSPLWPSVRAFCLCGDLHLALDIDLRHQFGNTYIFCVAFLQSFRSLLHAVPLGGNQEDPNKHNEPYLERCSFHMMDGTELEFAS